MTNKRPGREALPRLCTEHDVHITEASQRVGDMAYLSVGVAITVMQDMAERMTPEKGSPGLRSRVLEL